ncbi:CDP-alcohol phosphatidyltransferase family protein [Arthrobacter sp.]|uniref:CDP-alcohol phosphatidyltransferase family protein n=1 Tax=Arthrobacter sp. TaxID=1667 RepID=UPI0028A0E72D|nr:CDP-alcohol phosphatidyltransferase family protein [Arthrobacter sp.]
MDILNWLSSSADALPEAAVWALAGIFALLESGLGLGFFVPGETVVLLLAATFDNALGALVLFFVVMIGACAGDHVGYGIGRRFGPRLRETKLIRKLGVSKWDQAVDVLERRGAAAVFLTRLIPVVRTLTPAAAGVAKVAYRAFLPASLAGAATWSALYVGLGFLVRSSLEAMQKYVGVFGWILFGALAVAAAVLILRQRIAKRKTADADGDGGRGAESTIHTHLGNLRQQLFAEDEWRTVPNLITAVRIGFLPVFALLLFNGAYFPAVIVIGTVFATDWLDGFVARRTNTVSALGSWLDPVADRLTVLITVTSIAWAGLMPWQALVMMLIPDLVLGVIAAFAFKGSPDVPVTWIGKARTAVIFAGLFVLLLGKASGGSFHYAVGIGFMLYLLGVLGHWIAAGQYAKAMFDNWHERGRIPTESLN